MRNERQLGVKSTFTLLILLFTFINATSQLLAQIPIRGIDQDSTDCGWFRTQTPGGWGSTASGNNPGAYRDLHFPLAFPNGLTIGCTNTLHLSNASSVESFLPSSGTPDVLSMDLLDPVGYGNILAGHLAAITLSIGFDANDPDFSGSDIALGDLQLNNGPFVGWTINEVVTEANAVLGNCSGNYSPSQLTQVLSSINENFVDGTSNNGDLDCPPDNVLSCNIQIDSVHTYCNYDGTYTLGIDISGTNGQFQISDPTSMTGAGQTVCFGDPSDNSAVLNALLILTYPMGWGYSFTIVEVSPSTIAGCADPDNSADCVINEYAGASPECCQLVINCPWNGPTNLSCTDQIPDPDTTAIQFANNCGPVSINVSSNISGSGCSGNPFTFIRTYSVSDQQTTLTCTETFIRVDNAAPIITCPPDQYADCSNGGVTPDAFATAADDCDNDVFITYIDVPIGSSCDQFTRIWSAVDDCGNTAFCYQNVFVTDNLPPVLNVPNDITVDCGSDLSPPFTGMATAIDACTQVTLSYSDGPILGASCNTSFVRTWTATDACGNTSTSDQMIQLVDNTGPIFLNAPSNSDMQCGDPPPIPDVVAFDVCQNDTVLLTFGETIIDNGCLVQIIREWTAQDSCGNSSTYTQTITIEDTEGPQLICPDNVMLPCGSTDIDPADIGMATALDDCSGNFVVITYSDSSYTNACPPGIHRIWTAVDTCGNESSCIQVISFNDQLAPTLSCVNDTTVNCIDGGTGPDITGTPAVSDDCSDVSLNYNDGPFQGNCPMFFVRTWTASDACNNSTTCTQQITVIDLEAPILTCPADITINCAFATIDPQYTGSATATDQCLDVTISYTDGPITGLCPKSLTRTWTALDLCGNSSTCDQQILIEDPMVPVVFCPNDTLLVCGDNADPSIIGNATAIDFCSTVSVDHMDVWMNDDCPPAIHRTWIATDACGNTAQCIQVIQFIDTLAPTIMCPSDTVIACSGQSDPSITGWPVILDDCSEVNMTYTDSLVEYSDTTGADCGQFRTQTPGGWGSPASGNNPGAYRDAHFDDAFPNGLSIGCDLSLTLTSANAVEVFLPSGGTPSALIQDLEDPTSYGNSLAGHLVALTLSLGFDVADPDFGQANSYLGNLIVANGPFLGMTVEEIVAEANVVLGGCNSPFTPSQMTQVLSSINENYVDGGMNNGFLMCPDQDVVCFTIYRTWTATDVCGNSSTCSQIIQGSSDLDPISDPLFFANDAKIMAYPSPTNGELRIVFNEATFFGDRIEILALTGDVLQSYELGGGTDQFDIDLRGLPTGIYFIQYYSQEQVETLKVVKQ